MRDGELETLAREDVPVLLLVDEGDFGDDLARRIHEASQFRSGPLLRYKCGSFADPCRSPERMDRECARLFQLAHGGTLFFRHVHRLMPCEQRQLFAILEHGHFWLPDTRDTRAVDFRVLASTTPESLERAESGALLFRLGERVLRVRRAASASVD